MVEKPEGDETKGKIEFEDSGQGVTEAIAMCEGDEIFEIGSEAAEDDGGNYQTRAPKGQRGSSMGEGKGHSTIL